MCLDKSTGLPEMHVLGRRSERDMALCWHCSDFVSPSGGPIRTIVLSGRLTARRTMNDHEIAPLTILIVDDDARIRGALARWLELEGHQVETAARAHEALAAAEGRCWDLICLDAQLPDMAGNDLVRAIRARETSAYVVVVTGFASTFDDPGLLWPGVDSVLPKPWQAGELELVLDRALGRRAELPGPIRAA